MHKVTLCLPPIWVQEVTHEGPISASSSYIWGRVVEIGGIHSRGWFEDATGVGNTILSSR